MNIVLLLLTALLISITTADSFAANANRFKQDRFAIGFWVEPPFDDKADARYKEAADAGFNLAIVAFTPQAERVLPVAEKHGMKAIIQPGDGPVEEWADGPSCWGYLLKDEPNAKDFDKLGKLVEDVRKSHPGKLAYINLFPCHCTPKHYGVDTYEEYVTGFMSAANVDVLCMDHYPLFNVNEDSRDLYCTNLEFMRKHSLQAGIPFWNYFNTMPYGKHSDPTEAQLRWQIFTSIAYGAKGVLYFCYYTPPGEEFPKGGAIIARDDKPTRHYYQAKRLNEQINNLGPTLMQLTSTGVYRVKPEDDPAKALAGSGIINIKRADVDPGNDYLAGSFRHSDGRRAVMLVNYRFAYSAWPTVEFDVPIEQVRELDKYSGKEIPVRDESPDMPGLQISLEDGEGRLFILPDE